MTGTSFAAPFVTAIAAVTYNSSPLKASIRERRPPLDPKAAMLRAFAIEKVGSAEGQERSSVYGLGLVKAPAGCTAAQPPPAVAKEPAPVAAGAWQADVRRTSLR